jgi:RNA polymerase sigma-70 factor (ECF subfamily)
VSSSAEAIEALYRKRYAAFRAGLTPIAGSEEAARDVVQDAFALALQHRRRFRGDGTLEAWIWRIAFRVALKARRHGRSSVSIDELAEAASMPAADRDPELAEAVRALPPRRRLIVFLRYFADMSYRDIADVLDVSEGTVAASLAQARTELRELLEREGVSL